nr:hypothetical protein NG677_17585 [Methylobacterium sp. OTU13CASTA1]
MPGTGQGGARKPLIPAHPAGPYSTYRLFEWCMAVMMVLIACTLAMPGDTLDRGALKPLANIGMTEENMAFFFTMVGSVRCLALYLNGHINNFRVGPKGAIIRACCSALGCFVLGQFTAALIYDAIFVSSAPALNIPIFGALAGFEALSVYVAIQDSVTRNERLSAALAAQDSTTGSDRLSAAVEKLKGLDA